MIRFTQGNLLDAEVEALVNTVNTVGAMGKGIALMFKEAFPANFREYAAACKHKEVQTGRMFVTENPSIMGPRWIINFPAHEGAPAGAHADRVDPVRIGGSPPSRRGQGNSVDRGAAARLWHRIACGTRKPVTRS